MVCRETPIASASWPCARPRCVRSSRTWFFIAVEPGHRSGPNWQASSPVRSAASGQTATRRAWPGRDDDSGNPAHRLDGRPAALPDRRGNRADRDERRSGECCAQKEPACPCPHASLRPVKLACHGQVSLTGSWLSSLLVTPIYQQLNGATSADARRTHPLANTG